MRFGLTAVMILFQSLAACSGQASFTFGTAAPANVGGATGVAHAGTATPARAPTVGTLSAPGRPGALPSPQGAAPTNDIPPEIVSFVDTQLKGHARLGPPEAWVVRIPRDRLIESYRGILAQYGWKLVSDAGGPARSRILVFEMPQARVTAVFLSNGDGETRIYVVAALR